VMTTGVLVYAFLLCTLSRWTDYTAAHTTL